MTLVLIALAIALFHFGLVWFYFNSLPESIAIHFDFSGKADRWGKKQIIWSLPVIGFVCWMIMYFAAQSDQVNIPSNFEEADMNKMLAHLTLSTQLIFLLISYLSIQVSLGHRKGLGTHFIIIILILIFYPFYFCF